jgi:N-acetylglucosaminyl-diphospho-decaprenol L-rhamnosyltransferase
MDLSIVTVGYQSAGKLPEFLAAAARAAPDAEYVVVDNASSDNTGAVARENGAHQVIRNDVNLGFGRACNLGAQHAIGEWILFANPDILLESVPSLKGRRDQAYGLGAGVIAEDARRHTPALRAETSLAEDTFTQLWTRIFPPAMTKHFPKRRRPPRWASAAVLLCRKSEYEAVGGFDDRFFLYFEDRDLGRRYRKHMYPLHAEPALRANHGHGASSPGLASWVRESWSLVSWIEYRGIWQGQDAASATASLSLSTLRKFQAVGARLPIERARRKRQDIENILTHLHTFSDRLVPDLGFYPHAREALARLS